MTTYLKIIRREIILSVSAKHRAVIIKWFNEHFVRNDTVSHHSLEEQINILTFGSNIEKVVLCVSISFSWITFLHSLLPTNYCYFSLSIFSTQMVYFVNIIIPSTVMKKAQKNKDIGGKGVEGKKGKIPVFDPPKEKNKDNIIWGDCCYF